MESMEWYSPLRSALHGEFTMHGTRILLMSRPSNPTCDIEVAEHCCKLVEQFHSRQSKFIGHPKPSDRTLRPGDILALTQDPSDPQFELSLRGTSICCVTYVPLSDSVTIRPSTRSVHVKNLDVNEVYAISKHKRGEMKPGTWLLNFGQLQIVIRLTPRASTHAVDADLSPRVIVGRKRGPDPFSRSLTIRPRGHQLGEDAARPANHLDLKDGHAISCPGARYLAADYLLQRRSVIAQNTQSLLYTAWHSEQEDVIVVKLIKEPQEPRSIEGWMREYRYHIKLKHPWIVELFSGDSRYLSLHMQFIDAPALSRYRGDDDFCTLSQDAARHVLRNISAALAYVHEHAIAHNDVKPGNILYSRARGAVLCDFGGATQEISGLSECSTVGTPYYLPAEYLIDGSRGMPGDMWALGVVMLFLTCKIVYPESYSRKIGPGDTEPLYWQFDDVHQDGGAQEKFQRWLDIVKAARDSISEQFVEGQIIRGMVQTNQRQRTQAADIASLLAPSLEPPRLSRKLLIAKRRERNNIFRPPVTKADQTTADQAAADQTAADSKKIEKTNIDETVASGLPADETSVNDTKASQPLADETQFCTSTEADSEDVAVKEPP